MWIRLMHMKMYVENRLEVGYNNRRYFEEDEQMRKGIAGVLALLCSVVLFGCGSTEKEITTITVEKDKSLTSTIVEAFDRDYYDTEDLKEYTLDAVAAYNTASGGAVSVSKVEAKDGVVEVQMKYGNAQDYAGFNEKEFFVGTVAEAYDAGLDLDVLLQDISDKSRTAGKNEILQMGEKNLVVLEEEIAVEVPGKILYVSGGTEVLGTSRVVVHPGGGASYIIYN